MRTEAKTWLTPEDVDDMREACLTAAFPTYLQERNLALLELGYDTGLRRSELAGLDVDMLELEGEPTLRLPSRIQKGDPPEATLRLETATARQLRRYLRDRWKDTEAVFPARSSARMSGRSVTRLVKRIAEVADVRPLAVGGGRGEPSDVSAHTLRHSVAYRIIQREGGRLEDVQLRLRHADRATTDRVYSHLVPR